MFSYKLLAADPGMVPTSANCKLICVKAGLQGFQVGKTKVFLKYFHIDILVEHLERVQKAAANIQKSKWSRLYLSLSAVEMSC